MKLSSEHKEAGISMPEERSEIIRFLIEKKAYPRCSKTGKIFFLRRGRDDGFDELKERIIEGLRLKTEDDCKSVREIIKAELAKRRRTRPIKKWIKEERPREMLIKHGAETLTPAKLLAIILGTGSSEGVSAEDLARRILNHFGSLRAIDSAHIFDLQAIEGVGEAKAAQIKAALEIGKRLMREEAERKTKIRTVKDVVEYVGDYYAPYLRDKEKEFFNIILLDVRNKVIDNIELSKGSVSASVVDVKEIIKEATKKTASAIIMVHNHPSGDAEPSNDDIEITRRVVEACGLVGIKVLDHIVIGKNKDDYVSFMDRGLIKGV